MSSGEIAAKIEEIENGYTQIITDPPLSEFDTIDKEDQFIMISDNENEKVGVRSPEKRKQRIIFDPTPNATKIKPKAPTQVTRKKEANRPVTKPAQQQRRRHRSVKYVPVEAEHRAFDGILSELVPMLANVDDYYGDALLDVLYAKKLTFVDLYH